MVVPTTFTTIWVNSADTIHDLLIFTAGYFFMYLTAGERAVAAVTGAEITVLTLTTHFIAAISVGAKI